MLAQITTEFHSVTCSRVMQQEAARLYCLCRQPYNDKRPMLACDHCSEWFHYDCVGLLPPGEDDDDDAVAPKDFRCPACCLKVIENCQPGSLRLGACLCVFVCAGIMLGWGPACNRPAALLEAPRSMEYLSFHVRSCKVRCSPTRMVCVCVY